MMTIREAGHRSPMLRFFYLLAALFAVSGVSGAAANPDLRSLTSLRLHLQRQSEGLGNCLNGSQVPTVSIEEPLHRTERQTANLCNVIGRTTTQPICLRVGRRCIANNGLDL